jgi:hypothetical protein
MYFKYFDCFCNIFYQIHKSAYYCGGYATKNFSDYKCHAAIF